VHLPGGHLGSPRSAAGQAFRMLNTVGT